jgi:hypothetical protein
MSSTDFPWHQDAGGTDAFLAVRTVTEPAFVTVLDRIDQWNSKRRPS